MASLGEILFGGGNTAPQQSLGNAMAPQAVAAQSQQGGLGLLMQKLQQNPAAIQALLNTGSQLLNPTSYGSSGGRIASAVSSGVKDYSTAAAAADDKAYLRKRDEREQNREDRKVENEEDRTDISRDQLEASREQQATENEQFLKKYGLQAAELEARKDLWKAQAEKYGADADAVRTKAETGNLETLTGPERVMNNLAKILENKGVPSDQAYVMSFDIYNQAQESEAKALSAAAQSLGFLGSTPEGKQVLDEVMATIKGSFQTASDVVENAGAQTGGADVQEVAPGVTQADVNAALAAINQNSQTNVTWDQLTPTQRQTLISKIQERKGGQ